MGRSLFSREALCNENAGEVRRDLNAQNLRTFGNGEDLFPRAHRGLPAKKAAGRVSVLILASPGSATYRSL